MPPRAKQEPITEPETSQEIESRVLPTREELHDVDSWEAALALSATLHGDVLSITDTELADGFRKATKDDQDRLIGVPIHIISWRFVVGDYDNDGNDATADGDEFTVLHVVAKEVSGGTAKWIITDGGTGINRDLHEFTRKTRRMGGVTVPKGLRVSRYKIDSVTRKPVGKRDQAALIASGGKLEPAATYYLDTSQ